MLPSLYLGKWNPGGKNSITDVPGVLVHTESVRTAAGVNTGVTTILPCKDWAENSVFAGIFSFNGCGELTGTHWINETGLLSAPVILTGTSYVGDAYRGVMEYCFRHHRDEDGEMSLFVFPTVGETFDGFLSDHSQFVITPEHIIRSIENASADAVPEGSTGGGTGMICHRFKAGTGSSSRLVKGLDGAGKETTYTVGAVVQANYGHTDTLRIGGIPVGQIMIREAAAKQEAESKGVRKDGSIIIVIATDAPLLPIQLQRLAKRATVGLGKVGGYGNNTSGDIFLAFSTANKIRAQEWHPDSGVHVDPFTPCPATVQMTDNDSINGLFEAAADATEEAIYNSLFMAETMVGFKGRTVEALDLDVVKRVVEQRL